MLKETDEQRVASVLAEYNSLRAEILHADGITLSIMGLALSSTTLITSYALAKSSAFVFLVPLPMLWIALRYIAVKRWDIYRIGSYIRCRLERTCIGLGWETAVARAHQGTGGATFRVCRLTSCEFWLLIMMGLALILLFEGYYERPALYWVRALPIAGYSFYFASSLRVYRRLWRERTTRSLDAMWASDELEVGDEVPTGTRT